MTTAQPSRFTLAENSARDDDKAPHFSGTVIVEQSPYDAAAWLSKTRNQDPFVSLSLRPAGESNGQKISVAIWQKKNRTAQTDPHFRATQPILDAAYSISATLHEESGTGLFTLTLEMTPLGADELSPQAKIRHDEIAAVFRPGPTRESPPEAAARPNKFAQMTRTEQPTFKMPPNLNEHGEPDDIPF